MAIIENFYKMTKDERLDFYDKIKDNNNKILFNKLKKKYFKRFIINKYPTIDLNLLNNYEKSELFHNNMIIYLTKNQ